MFQIKSPCINHLSYNRLHIGQSRFILCCKVIYVIEICLGLWKKMIKLTDKQFSTERINRNILWVNRSQNSSTSAIVCTDVNWTSSHHSEKSASTQCLLPLSIYISPSSHHYSPRDVWDRSNSCQLGINTGMSQLSPCQGDRETKVCMCLDTWVCLCWQSCRRAVIRESSSVLCPLYCLWEGIMFCVQSLDLSQGSLWDDAVALLL